MTEAFWNIPDPDTQPQFYADVPVKRLLAWVADSIVVLVICVLILPFTAFTGLFFFPLLFLTIGLIYRTATLARHSATWGMRLMSIEFRTGAGRRFDAGMAFWHSLGFTFSCAVPIVQVASVLLMLTGPRGQGATDHVLGTVAVNRRAESG
ncbi:MAG: RDD family protein [Roseovarius sp.]